MSDPERLNVLRRALISQRGGADPPAPSSECLPEDVIAVLAQGDAGQAREFEHLADCAYCRRAVASVTGALADPVVAREIAAASKRRHVRLLPVALPLAAAAGLVLLLWSSGDQSAPLHRDPARAGAVPLPVQPVGPVAQVSRLIWTLVPGADRYRVTLFDTQGGVLYEAQSEDTALAVPDSISLLDGRRYLWKVDARTGWDRWTASELVEFTVLQRLAP